ncbi:phage portal protein [Anaerocolumna sp. AGMB13020]|uniref:phage portal protein n=1 Tax=Anaerocolumna sp. AGMB13020 TaxID=3081750 RepID=UPI002953E3F0|nr:phage portal protein [Anaerocolumna sp. AGMB13020]WOO34939.1 phage portal protein [Anaerocolumna sp. AGMB13020]
MGWIDEVAYKISPQWAYKREAWRQELDSIRNYDAGALDRNNANWNASNLSAEFTDKYDRDKVRARARDLERNSDMATSVVKAFKRNIIGGGFKLQARTSVPEINNKLEEYWKEWCKKENCDVTGVQSFNQLLRMAVQRKKVDGGILFIKRYTDDGLIPFKLQAIEVDELAKDAVTNGERVVGGIKYNEYNKPLGYYIKQYDIDGYTINEPVYIPAKDVIFIYSKKRPSQIREMSDMAPTVTRIRDINEFMTAVSVKERIAACLAVFIKKNNPNGAGGFDKRNNNNANTPEKKYDGKTLIPGMIRELNVNEDAITINPSGQATDAAAFVKLQQRLIASGQGISYESTSRDMSEVNYSSARQGSIEDDLEYTEDGELIEEFMAEVYEAFVTCIYLTGLIKFKDFYTKKQDYIKHEWVKAPKRWIDPVKEANANKIALATGQKTLKDIAAENGRDWREVVDEMAEINDYANKKGLDLGGALFGQKTAQKQTG